MPPPTRRRPVPAESGVSTVGTRPAGRVPILDGHRMVSAALRTSLRRAGLDAHELPVGGVDAILVAAVAHPEAVVLLEPVRCLAPPGPGPGASALVAALRAHGKSAVVLTERLDDPVTAAGSRPPSRQAPPGWSTSRPRSTASSGS